MKGKWRRYKRSIIESVSNGRDINALNERGETFLHRVVRANNYKLVRFLLIKQGADPNVMNNTNDTPLYTACKHKASRKLIKFLIWNGADVDLQNHEGSTILHCILKENFKEKYVKLLLHFGADINIEDDDGDTPLSIAYNGHKYITVSYILKYKPDIGYSQIFDLLPPIFQAASCFNIADIKSLLEDGEDINKMNYIRQNLLHYTLTFLRPGDQRQMLMKVLLEKGIDSNAPDGNSHPPLHLALYCKDEAAAKVLIEYECNVNLLDGNLRSALYIAVIKGLEESVKLLLSHDADDKKKMPFDSDVIQWPLKVHKIPLITYAAASKLDDPTITEILLDYGANPNEHVSDYRTPLTQALASHNYKIAITLLARGASFRLRDGTNSVPLDMIDENELISILDKGDYLKWNNDSSWQFIQLFNEAIEHGRQIGDYELVNKCMNATEIMIKELVIRMRLDNLQVNPDLMQQLIESNENNYRLYSTHKRELDLMQSTKINENDGYNILDILRKNHKYFVNALIECVESEEAALFFYGKLYQQIYPCYGEFLYLNYLEGKKKSELISKSAKLLPTKIPILKFCMYLSNSDLENFIKNQIDDPSIGFGKCHI